MSFLRRCLHSIIGAVPNNIAYVIDTELRHKRAEYNKGLLGHYGSNFQLSGDAFLVSPGCVTFGDDCCVNEFVHVLGGGGLHCGNGVWIANHASIITSTHPSDVEFIGAHPQINLPVHVEDNVWIGSHAVILPGVTLGRSCIIGAASVVTKDIPPYTIAVGVPARVIRNKDMFTEGDG